MLKGANVINSLRIRDWRISLSFFLSHEWCHRWGKSILIYWKILGKCL